MPKAHETSHNFLENLVFPMKTIIFYIFFKKKYCLPLFVVYIMYTTMSYIRKIKRGNKTYLAEVESTRVNGKVVQKHLRYVGREVNNKTVISISSKDLQVDEVKVYGPLVVLNEISNIIGLPEILGKYSNEILSMVYAHCINYQSVNNMPEWYKRTDLNSILNLENLTEAQLLSGMDSLNDEKIEQYQRKIFNNVKRKYNLSSRGLVYDVTNTYLYGSKCQLGKLGKSKDGKRQNPLIQIGLATTQREGIPVFHKTFDGNTHDSKTLSALVKDFSDYKIRSGLFVYDWGITSTKNINSIGKLGWNTLCGISINIKEKKIIRNILKERGPILDISNRVIINKNIFYVQTINHKIGKFKGKLAICYNDRKRQDIREFRYDEITNAQNLLSQNKNIKEGLKKYLTPSGRLRRIELEKSEEFDGFSCIFCTNDISDKEMIKLYFDKDIIEKAFRTLKGITNLRPIRHWLYNRVTAHVFICYLSYLLLSVLKFNLKKLQISPEQALKDLGSMYKICLYDKKKQIKIIKTVTLNRHQEEILKSINKKLLKDCSVHF